MLKWVSLVNGKAIVARIVEVVGAMEAWSSSGGLNPVLLWCLPSACSVPAHWCLSCCPLGLRYLFDLCTQCLFLEAVYREDGNVGLCGG